MEKDDRRNHFNALLAERNRAVQLYEDAKRALEGLRTKCTHPLVAEREYTKGETGQRVCLICNTREYWYLMGYWRTLTEVHMALPAKDYDKLGFLPELKSTLIPANLFKADL